MCAWGRTALSLLLGEHVEDGALRGGKIARTDVGECLEPFDLPLEALEALADTSRVRRERCDGSTTAPRRNTSSVSMFLRLTKKSSF